MRKEKFIILVSLVIIYSCKNNNITEPNKPQILQLPSLADSIPYSMLGSGKIAFQRIGPQNNNYEGIYILDIDNKKNWDINFSPIDGPQISPEGDKIAFSKYTDSKSGVDIYGNNSKQISNLEGQEENPTWLPDDQNIIFRYYLSVYIPAYVYDTQSATANYIIDFSKIDFPNVHDPFDIISCSNKNVCITGLSNMGICSFGLKWWELQKDY